MKRLIMLITIITFILSMVGFNYADTESVEILIPEFEVRVNGILIDTAHSQYPVMTYKNITYFPMTSDYLAGIGLNLSFSGAEGLKINIKDEIGELEQNFLGASNLLGSSHAAQITPFKVEVNGKVLNNAEEEYPILLYKNITYFPMTWRFAVTEFGWSTKWSASTGFGIIIEKEGELEEINYVSIGDSIATGFSDVKNTEAYPVGIEKLLSGAKKVNYNNDVTFEGMTTEAILLTIESPEFPTSRFATAITKADIITISIGGNDLLSALLKPVVELADNLNDGVELFYQNWPKIVGYIRIINPTADIYVLNLYNPFNYTLLDGYEYEYKLYDLIELAIGAVNAKIDNVNYLSPTHIPLYEYEVVDVYSAFNEYQPSSMGEVTYMYSENLSERDIHPNQNGQNIIFSLIKDLME